MMLSLLCSASLFAQEESDTLFIPFLTDNQLSFIADASTITAFQINSFLAEKGEKNVLEEFQILQASTLEKAQATDVKNLLLDEGNYFFTNKKKQCFFLPQVGFQVANAEDTMNIVVSFDCNMIRFHQGGEQQLFYLSEKMSALRDFTDELFPPVLAANENEPQLGPVNNVNNTYGFTPMGSKYNAFRFELECLGASSPFGYAIEVCQPKPIYYVLKSRQPIEELTSTIGQDCQLNVSLSQLCQFNSLSFGQLRQLEAGDQLIVGYK